MVGEEVEGLVVDNGLDDLSQMVTGEPLQGFLIPAGGQTEGGLAGPGHAPLIGAEEPE